MPLRAALASSTVVLSPTLSVATKVSVLPRPWPLLRDHQDPDSLSARVAFHLHRMNILGNRLTALDTGLSQQQAQNLTTARLPLTQPAVDQLATLLGLDSSDLTRHLTEDERDEWFFYRISARDPSYPWQRAQSYWRHAGKSASWAAATMKVSKPFITACTKPDRPPTTALTLPKAQLLSTALSLPIPCWHYLPPPHDKGPPPRVAHPSR